MGRSSVRVGWSATRGSNGPRGSNTRAFRVGGFVIRLFSLVTFHNRMVGVFLSVRPQTQIVSAFRVVNSGSRMSAGRSVQVCTNTSCKKAGSRGILDVFRAFAPANVDIIESGCQGKCGLGPNIRTTTPAEEVYQGVLKPATAAAIVELDFSAPVPDAIVDEFSRVLRGDAFLARGLHVDALGIYQACLATGALDGTNNALSIVKLKASQAMRMVARTEKKKGRGSGKGGESVSSFEEAEATAREAIDKWRGNAAAWLQLSEVLVDMGRTDDALKSLDTLSREVPDARFDASAMAALIRNR